jgi:hypothetical protein
MTRHNGKDSPSSGDNDYAVGYRKPPLHSRFRAGQSGNPAGRRQGVRNLKTDVRRTLSTPIKVKEGGRTRNKSTQEGALMVLREKALRGDARALDRIIELAKRAARGENHRASRPLWADGRGPLRSRDRNTAAAQLMADCAAKAKVRIPAHESLPHDRQAELNRSIFPEKSSLRRPVQVLRDAVDLVIMSPVWKGATLCPGPTTSEFAEVANMQGAALFEGPVPVLSAAEVARQGYAAL